VTAEETSLADQTPEAEQLERPDDDGGKPGRLKRFTGRIKLLSRAKTAPAILAFLVLASAALAACLLYFWYRPDRAADAAAAKSAITAASDGTVAILSYSPDTLDRDFASAKSHLTGDFLSYYNQFTQQIVGPAAKQKSVKTTAVVVRAAVSELHLNSAVVLVFVNQSTMSADRTDPTLASSSVLVTLTKAHGTWLISSFNPV
jgi:Mce-associated membrane protein